MKSAAARAPSDRWHHHPRSSVCAITALPQHFTSLPDCTFFRPPTCCRLGFVYRWATTQYPPLITRHHAAFLAPRPRHPDLTFKLQQSYQPVATPCGARQLPFSVLYKTYSKCKLSSKQNNMTDDGINSLNSGSYLTVSYGVVSCYVAVIYDMTSQQTTAATSAFSSSSDESKN